MELKNIKNDQINSSLIKIEVLKKEYEVVLQRYQEAIKNYISSVISNTDKNDTYANIKGRAWWGSKGIVEGAAATIEECENMCSSSELCSGATFNKVSRYCWARRGDGDISAGKSDDYAIILEKKEALSIIHRLNKKLLLINEKIMKEIENISPEFEQINNSKYNKHIELKNSYNFLLEKKLKMEKKLQEYYSIKTENEEQTLYVNQKNNAMRNWTIFTFLLILITIKKMYGSETPPVSKIIWIFIILSFISLTYTIANPSGFAMWIILFACIILMKLGYLPSP